MEELLREQNFTYRPVNAGAEKWINVPIPCLDKGFIYLVDYQGEDKSIVQAARTSYGKGTKKVSDDRALIRHLMRHSHTTPFEMVEFKFHAKLPIFVAREWVRHRTANINEYSARFSEMPDEFYLPAPEVLCKQDKNNKQGRSDERLSRDQEAKVLAMLGAMYASDYGAYQEFLDMELARELARIGLSVASYTTWYWKIDLHNLLHFLKLRMDKNAMYEIRIYAEAIAQIVKDAMPIVFEAFEDYELYAIKMSRPEQEFIKKGGWPNTEDVIRSAAQEHFKNKRETEEFIEKLKRLGFVKGA